MDFLDRFAIRSKPKGFFRKMPNPRLRATYAPKRCGEIKAEWLLRKGIWCYQLVLYCTVFSIELAVPVKRLVLKEDSTVREVNRLVVVGWPQPFLLIIAHHWSCLCNVDAVQDPSFTNERL